MEYVDVNINQGSEYAPSRQRIEGGTWSRLRTRLLNRGYYRGSFYLRDAQGNWYIIPEESYDTLVAYPEVWYIVTEEVFLGNQLVVAARDRNLQEVTSLIQRGANPNATSVVGTTALINAARFDDLAIVQYLLRAGADANILDNFRDTALLAAASRPDKIYPIMYELVQAGANVNVKDSLGHTPLYYVAEAGNLDAVRLFISAGADVNEADWYGNTPLHQAVHNRHLAVAEYLLQSGANPNAVRSANITALHWAIQGGVNLREDFARLLMDYGADKNIRNVHGQTAEDVARALGDLEAANFIRDYELPSAKEPERL